jgi:hypothetical protein
MRGRRLQGDALQEQQEREKPSDAPQSPILFSTRPGVL